MRTYTGKDKVMGNRQAFTTFEATVMVLYRRCILTIDLLDEIGVLYRGMDVDYGGYAGIQAEDGRDVYEAVVRTLYPDWKPVKDEHYLQVEAEYGEAFAFNDALEAFFVDVTSGRWGWW